MIISNFFTQEGQIQFINKATPYIGLLLMLIAVAMLAVHSYFTFIASHAPYNLSKGHLEVGFFGLLFFLTGKFLFSMKKEKEDNRTCWVLFDSKGLAISTSLNVPKNMDTLDGTWVEMVER